MEKVGIVCVCVCLNLFINTNAIACWSRPSDTTSFY